MAVTEAGCDLTYCKMRGIVAVLTGERQKQYNITQAAHVLYWLVTQTKRTYWYVLINEPDSRQEVN